MSDVTCPSGKMPARTASGYRDYPESMRREVVFIAMSRRIGFSLQAIGELLPAYRAGRLSIATMDEALQERAAALQRQIDDLQAQQKHVIEHASWLRDQDRKQRARNRPASPWPKTAARKDTK